MGQGRTAKLSPDGSARLRKLAACRGADGLAKQLHIGIATFYSALDGGLLRPDVVARIEESLRIFAD